MRDTISFKLKSFWNKMLYSHKKYDPANFYLIYALKATLAMSINAFFAYWLFDSTGVIFALNVTMGIFFLANLDCTDGQKVGFLILHLFLCSCFMFFVEPFMNFGPWLSIAVFMWIFFVGYSTKYNPNLNKVLMTVSMTGFVAFIVHDSIGLDIPKAIGGLCSGWCVSVLIKFGRFRRYGAFVSKSMPILINDLCDMTHALRGSNFLPYSDKALAHINSLKSMFESDSINLKDPILIRNHARAVFYLYKFEEIYYSLISIRGLFRSIDDKNILSSVRAEIFHNIRELILLFHSKTPIIRTNALDKVKHSRYQILASSLEVLYKHLNLIIAGGENKIKLKGRKKITFADFFTSIGLKDAITLSSFRFAFCVSIAILISQLTKLDHGVWIAIAIFSLNRANRYTLKAAGKDNIVGGVLGFLLSLCVVYVDLNQYISYLIALLGMFFVYYFRNYSSFAFATVFMFEFSLVFSFIKDNFLSLILYRIFDVILGFIVVYIVSIFTMPQDIEDVKLKLRTVLKEIINFFNATLIEHKKGSFIVGEQKIHSSIIQLRSAANQSKNEKMLIIAKTLSSINTDLLNLRNYIKLLKAQNINSHEASIQSDMQMLSRRFEMMDKKLMNLPYYFVEDIDDKILSKEDAKLLYLVSNIAKKQLQIYSLLN